ncbi:LysR family transcriptional regulator [Kribbella deserti]|uniref:LysR substrate-binding domain-containing protein n=1 Tax=Kribbella deserti TaxID=1926257 RepID=A0ABV6QSZ2_9ACTN
MMDRLVAEDLEAFAVFAAHRNFTHAATALHVSQPALHARIRKLEKKVGKPLVIRQGRNLLLTDTGERFAAFANDTRTRAAAFLATLNDAPPRPLTLAAGAGAYVYLLGEAIRRYLEQAPGGLNLVTADAEATLNALRDGSADIGVTALGVLPDDLSHEPLCQLPQVLAMRPEHRLAGRRTVRLKDLEGEALVVPPPSRPHRQALERSFLDAGVDWSVAVEAQGWQLQLHFVELGVGPAVVNGSVRTPQPLVTARIRDLPPVRYYVLTRPEHPDSRVDILKALLTRLTQ